MDGRQVAVVVRKSRRESAAQRIESLMQMWEEQFGGWMQRPVIIEGDICQPMLGVNAECRDWIAAHCTEILHSAASLKFHADGSGEPWSSNVGGTENMLDLCASTGIAQVHYVSTAYVCGLREGTIFESDLDCGQAFRNEYEQSKLEAEKRVRAAKFIESLTVYRPAVIAGDTVTGYTNTYHGIYLYLRLMSLIVPRQPLGADGRRYIPIRLPLTGEERRNVVPIDWVSEVIAYLVQQPRAHGRTFHLAPRTCITPRDVNDAGDSFFNSTGVEYVGQNPIDPSTYNSFEAEILPAFSMYESYGTTDPEFDYGNLNEFAPHLPCPKIDLPMLHRYIRFGESDQWGKRRLPRPKFDSFARDYFARVTRRARRFTEFDRPLVAVDLVGPGGGQWTLGLNSLGDLMVVDGLVADTDSMLRMCVADFKNLIAVGDFMRSANYGSHDLAMRALSDRNLSLMPSRETAQSSAAAHQID